VPLSSKQDHTHPPVRSPAHTQDHAPPIDGAAGQRFIICHNPDQAERDRLQRERALARIEAELERIKAQRERDHTKAKTGQLNEKARARAENAHVRAECALRDHPTLKRWIRQQRNGGLVIDRAKVKAEANLDGKYLLATSDPDITAEDTALGYKNLLEAERGFRDRKSELLLRPIFHRLDHRIRAHVLICWLALLLTRVAERKTGQSWRNIRREPGRLKHLAGEAATITQTTPLRPGQKAIYPALSVTPPPRVSVFDPT
jgi:transposase